MGSPVVRVNTNPRRQNSRRDEEGRTFPQHLQWLRGRDCLVADKPGHVCAGKIEAHHVNEGHQRGMGQKAPDYYAVPVCSAAHAAIHTAGHKTWQLRHGVNLLDAAAAYAKASPHRFLWEVRP